MRTTEKLKEEVNVRQVLFRGSRCLVLAANAVRTCIHNTFGGQTTPHKHKTQLAHKSEHKTTKHTETSGSHQVT